MKQMFQNFQKLAGRPKPQKIFLLREKKIKKNGVNYSHQNRLKLVQFIYSILILFFTLIGKERRGIALFFQME